MLQLLGGAGAGIGLAVACAPIRSPSTASPPVLSAGRPALQARKGGTLVYGQIASILNTLPYPSSPPTVAFKWAMFNPLVSLDERKQPLPSLAESWSFSEDRLTLTFKLRQGVVFHSGRPFTADEAKWSIEFAQDPRNAAQSGAELRAVQVRVVDSATLELKLGDVMPHVFSLLTDVMIVDPQSDITQNSAGTGAFRLEALTPGVEMRLIRNVQYWRPDRPLLDAVTITTIADPSSAVAYLESGTVGLLPVRYSDVRQLKAETGISVVVVPATGNYEFLLNTVDPPFNDLRVRQAIDLALDRTRFSETLLYGLGVPTYTMWPRTSPAWDASIDVGEFNLTRARQLLVSAGYGAGFETRIQGSSVYQEEILFDQIVQADLARIGITASVEPLESALATSVLAQAKFPALLSHAYAFADADPAMAFTAFPFRPSGNASRFQSPEYTAMVDAARRESDGNKRIRLYRQIATFVKDQAFVLPLANATAVFGMRSNVQGFARQPLFTGPVFEDIWLT